MIGVAHNLSLPDPDALEIRRPSRYDGSGFSLRSGELADEDRDLVFDVYARILEIQDGPEVEEGEDPIGLLDPLGPSGWIPRLAALGSATWASRSIDERTRQILHDLKGGALTGLAGYASFWKRLAPDDRERLAPRVHHLARDHAKIMRAAVEDLDPPRRDHDEIPRAHDVGHFLRDLEGQTFEAGGSRVVVHVEQSWDGWVAARCLEAAAVDRMLYNLVNNAARFAAEDRIRVLVGRAGNHLVRWLVGNHVSEGQLGWLRREVGSNLGELFLGGHTRGGQGVGLRGCAELIRVTFGLDDAEQAIREGYLGADLDGAEFWSWFHWPILAEDDAPEACAC